MPSVPLNIHDQNIPLRVEFYNALNVNIEEASMVLVRALKAGRASNDCPISLGEKIDALKEIFVKPHREEQFSRAFNQAVEYVVDDISSEAEKIVLNVQNVDAVCGEITKAQKFRDVIDELPKADKLNADFSRWVIAEARQRLGFNI